MLFGPVTVSTSSGMWVRPIDLDASRSSMTFGFTPAGDLVTIGMLLMSVSACACDANAIASTSAAPCNALFRNASLLASLLASFMAGFHGRVGAQVTVTAG